MEKEMILVGGLGFGDEGKGSIVDYLVRSRCANVVIRYNGGAQAGHNVVIPGGPHHTFSQFGSGTFVPGVKTHLSRFMVVNPLSMIKEEEHLRRVGIKDSFFRTTIDGNALVTTPFQIAANRLLEIWRSDKRHGSCGIGVGQTIDDYLKHGDKVLFVKDLRYPEITAKKLKFLQKESRNAVSDLIPNLPQTETAKRELEWLEDKTAMDDLAGFFLYFSRLVKVVNDSYLEELISKNSVIIFEGAQGALLDRNRGFYPYVTKTDTTFANAVKLLKNADYDDRVTKIGVLRALATRHGPGPFVTEDDNLSKYVQDPNNQENEWQGKFRFGWQDILALRYAIEINGGVDGLAITNMDQLSNLPEIKICVSYEHGNGVKILDFNNLPRYCGRNRNELSTFLQNCKPLGFMKFSCEKDYLDFLQSKDGLGKPARIISCGPTWKEKHLTE